MEVKLTSSRILTIPMSTHPTEIPLTIFDRVALNVHVAILYAFTPPTSSNTSIIAGLYKTLHHFPTLTGHLTKNGRGRPCIMLGDSNGGALVVEAKVSSKLEDHLPLTPSPEFRLLHPEEVDAVHILQVQLNRFQCGGLVIGVTAHHRVADGQSMSSFFVAWGKMVRGVAIDPLPVYDRHSWLIPRDPPLLKFNHWGTDFMPLNHPQQNESKVVARIDVVDPSEITSLFLHFSQEFITKLKARTNSSTEKHTTFETLLGYLWRKVTIARQLDGEECTKMRVAVNGRRRLRPPVLPEFFGNLVLDAHPSATARALIEGGVAVAAAIVRKAVRVLGEDYFRSFIDFGEVYGDEELVPYNDEDGNVLLPEMEVDSWLGLGFHEVDFGGGGNLCGFLPSWVPLEGVMIFAPAVSRDGGVDVFVALLEEHAVILRKISHSIMD